MDRYTSKEIAFYNILRTSLNFDILEEKSKFKISLNKLTEETGFSKKVIINNLKKLEDIEILRIVSQEEEKLILDISNTKNKFTDFFSNHEIDHILKKFDYFLNKYDEFLLPKKDIEKYVQLAKEQLKYGASENTSFNDMIKIAIPEVFVKSKIVEIEKKIYDMCDKVDEEDLPIIELVLFSMTNFSKQENPFYVTLFLSSIHKNLY
ncbi:MAG: hypothetical protein ACQERZ_00520 [Fusobacteriota bacterium]